MPEIVAVSSCGLSEIGVYGYDPDTEDLYYTVYYSDGSVDAPEKVTMLDPVTSGVAAGGSSFDIDGGDKQIDAVQLTMGEGKIKIPVISFSVEQTFDPQPLELNFTAELFDTDDDSIQDTFSVDFTDDAMV